MVHYEATGVAAAGGAVTVSCIPPSGSTFVVGNTVVTCTAVDQRGNVATGSFVVTVQAVSPVNDAPLATDGALAATENVFAMGALVAADARR